MLQRWISGLILVAGVASAGAAVAADIKGSADHPLLSRFPAAEIRAYQVKEFDAAVLPSGKIDDSDAPGDLLEIEGKITRIAYRIPGDRSVLEVMRNYENALAKAGFKTLFACGNPKECGADMMAFIALSDRVRPSAFGDASFGESAERALLAHRSDDAGDIHVFLHVVEDPANKRTIVYQQIVEGAALQVDQVKVLQANELQQSLDRQGHVAIPGVYFDTGKADIKPESDAALVEMAKLLKADTDLKVYIVGHTDNVGSLDANMTLSSKRAKAVAKALSTSYQIDAARLAAKGVASLAPVASNADEAGRARNRRVEIVVQ